jgi:hypothetical protein
MVQSEIISTFLPARVKEQFLAAYVLERFQAPGEEVTNYVMSVVAAANILGFAGSQEHLVRRMVQNMHSTVKAHFVFESWPESVRDLFTLATTVTEAVAVEEQWKRRMALSSKGAASQPLVTSVVRAKEFPAQGRF